MFFVSNLFCRVNLLDTAHEYAQNHISCAPYKRNTVPLGHWNFHVYRFSMSLFCLSQNLDYLLYLGRSLDIS